MESSHARDETTTTSLAIADVAATATATATAAATAVTAAVELRHRGNFEFGAGRLDAAWALYTAAMEQCTLALDSIPDDTNDETATTTALRDELVVNLCNRSACAAQQDEWEASRDDAAQAWELSRHTSIKAAYRLSKTCLHIQDSDTAQRTISAALAVLDQRDMVAASANGSPSTSSTEATSTEPTSTNTPSTNTPSTNTPSTNTPSTNTQTTAQQRAAFQDLWKQLLTAALRHKDNVTPPETSIKYVKRPISIKEFLPSRELGHGNFSEIVTVTHTVTNEAFALKKIAKKQAADLAKRQHPNVYNEIQMERRVLLERLASPGHPFIVRMYHAFQDYNSLYYLMDLHVERGDLWSQLRYKNLPGFGETEASSPSERLVMMGCHRSTARLWTYELLSALEYMHSRGIVHRDLKAENILLSATGHVVVIDFGTAKDLLQTDWNGPEFVGTPDFMSPEAVTGTDPPSSSLRPGAADTEASTTLVRAAGPAADVWALGALVFILQTGHTPYWSPSQYLAFLKIKRALQYPNLMRPTGIVDDECWDFIRHLMRGEASHRLGGTAYGSAAPPAQGNNPATMTCQPGGYDCLRQHAYLAPIHNELRGINESDNTLATDQATAANRVKSLAVPIPSLWDFSVRAVAELAYRDSLDIAICDRHVPGDGSSHDLLRLGPRERAAVWHCLDRRQLLSEPRLYARWFTNVTAARLDKIRVATHDVVGLTQMNDDQGKPPRAQMHDPYATPMETDPIAIAVVTNPLFFHTDADEVTRKVWTKHLKKCVAHINRSRPKLVVAVLRHVDEAARQILARISETIPTVVHDGSTFFTAWKMGVQCLALQSSTLDASPDNWQMQWIREQLEQVRMSKHPLFVFIDADPNQLDPFLVKYLARGRALCLFGVSASSPDHGTESTVSYEANEAVDDVSIRSTDSDDDDKDNFTMKVKGTSEAGVYTILVEDEPDMWSADFEPIG